MTTPASCSLIPCLLSAGLLLLGCRGSGSDADRVYRFSRFAMGTVVEYALEAPDERSALAAVDAAHAEILRLDTLLWEGNSGSEIAALNAAQSSVVVSRETADFIERLSAYSTETDGYFDPSIWPVLRLYDFDGAQPAPPPADRLDEALSYGGMSRFAVRDTAIHKTDPLAGLAASGAAKGYAVDRAVAVLRQTGITAAIVNAGGDMYCLGRTARSPWRVGIQDPDRPQDLVAALEIHDAAVATSGDYQRYFDHNGRRYHHLLDPDTGLPASGFRSVTVVAPRAELADVLATALFVAGPAEFDRLAGRFPHAAVFAVTADGEAVTTPTMETLLLREPTADPTD